MTGSRAYNAVGLSFYESPWSTYQVVTGQTSEVKSGDNPALDFGTKQENDARQRYQSLIPDYSKVLEAGIYLPADPTLRDDYMVSIDGACHASVSSAQKAQNANDPILGANGLVEIKVPYANNYKSVKPIYMAQMQYQMWITDMPINDNAVVFYGNQKEHETLTAPIVQIWRVKRDEQYIAWMRQRLEVFVRAYRSASDQNFNESNFPLQKLGPLTNNPLAPPRVRYTDQLKGFWED